MAKFYSTAKLSERISETPEGFLICEGVAITRAGDLFYAPGETPIDPKEGQNYVTITRSIDDIHDPATIASFEGKPVTINHPDDFVTPENWKELAVGVVQNVRPGEGEDADKLLADLLITDAEAIYAVKAKRMREVSCGYEAEYIEIGPGKGRHRNIIGNHLALVAAGRCGSECAIFDHAPKEKPMKLSEKIMALLGKAIKDAKLDDVAVDDDKDGKKTGDADAAAVQAKVLDDLNKRLDELMSKLKTGDADDKDGKKDGEEDDADDKSKDAGATIADIAKRIGALEDAFAKMGKKGGEEDSKDGKGKDAAMCTDQEVIARAEILAPGIVKTDDVKVKALDAAYGTEDGKAVIDLLLGGKAYDSADKDLLFIGASEMLKGVRKQQLSQQTTLDKLPGMQAGAMTPEKINQMNAERYGNK